MRYSNRLFLYAPFVVLLILAAAAVLRWRQVAAEWETGLLAANRGHEIAPGVTLHFASEEIGGFPFNLDVVLGNMVLAVQSTGGPISLRSERFAIHTLTYGRAQQIFEAAGTQTVSWTDIEGATHRFVFVPGSLHAGAIEREGRLARFDLDLDEFASPALTGVRAQFHIRTAQDRDALDFAIRAENLRISPAGKSSRAELPQLDIAGRIVPAAPLSALLSGHDEWRRAIGNWRAASGALRFDRVDIDWDASRLTGIGVFALDETHRVSGELKIRVSDAQHWKPTHLAEIHFTLALQELANANPRASASPLPLSLDVHNGAAIVSSAAGPTYRAGTIDPIF